MAYFISGIKNAITSRLPQNEHAKNAAKLKQEINDLETSLNDKTGTVFQSKVQETTQTLVQEKKKCIEELTRMNGSYYQDPKSGLKKNWDKLAVSVRKALNVEVERNQLPTISSQLEKAPETEDTRTAKSKIISYLAVEKKRDERQAQLERIIATEKASTPTFEEQTKSKKEALQKRHRELCGEYFGDANGKLDKAWRQYQTAIQSGSSGEFFLKVYKSLEEQRKTIEAELHSLEKQSTIPATPESTFEALTTSSVSKQIETLKDTQIKESNLSGVNWKGLGLSAAKMTLLAAGYILTV